MPIFLLWDNIHSLLKDKYFYCDTYPLSGINYYRLKQTDFDGNFKYVGITTLTFTNSGNFINISEPIIIESKIDLSIGLSYNDKCIIKLSDVSGRMIYSKIENLKEGSNNISIPAHNQKGFFLISVIFLSKGIKYNYKIIIN